MRDREALRKLSRPGKILGANFFGSVFVQYIQMDKCDDAEWDSEIFVVFIDQKSENK